jgi:hypothetical protein
VVEGTQQASDVVQPSMVIECRKCGRRRVLTPEWLRTVSVVFLASGLTRSEKRRIIAAADREGKAIKIDELRKTIRESLAQLPEPEQDAATNAMELLLLRLEVKHGQDIPVLAANEELDRLESAAEPVGRSLSESSRR